MLEAKKLNKSFSQGNQKLDIIKNLSFSIKEGESSAIVGRSGSGKSTLLSLLSGLELPDTGDILIDGQSLSTMSISERSQVRGTSLGIVFQSFYLLNFLTAKENVELPLNILNKKENLEQVEFYLQALGMGDRMDHKPPQLSGGECQRVAIARALVTEPKYILADEPTGNLDFDTGEKVMEQFLKVIGERNVGLILVTHSMEMANRCNKVYKFVSGQLIEQ